MEDEKFAVYGLLRHERPKNIHSDWENHGRFIVSLVKRLEDGKIRNFTDTWGNDDGLSLHLADLNIRCFYNVKGGVISELYGWSIEYDPHTVNLGRAKKMVKTLRKIHKRLDAMHKDWGNPETFGAFALRVLKAVGAKGFVRRSKDCPGFAGYDESTWLDRGLTDLNYAVVNEVADYQEEIKNKAAA